MSELNLSNKVCVVVGASHAGSLLAVQLRKEGWDGKIILIGEEEHLPYHRPPLSKSVLAGEKLIDAVQLRQHTLYATNDIELRLGQRVVELLPAAQMVRLEGGEEIHYDKLALCTGASVRHIGHGDGLDGVHYLRTADDVQAIQRHILAGNRAVIVGGGYIGLEVAAILAKRGLEVTVLEMADRILQRVTGPTISAYLQSLHQQNGVNIVTGVTVSEIGGEGKVSSVICEDGSEFAADLVIIGVGVLPQTALAAGAGLLVGNGVVVDEFTRTSDEHIYAAGDCTWHPNSLYDRHVRLECVQNALDQAKVAAANITGKNLVYASLPWFWSDQYDIKLQSAGLVAGYDHFLVRGDRDNADGTGFSVFYFRGDKMIAADCVNRAKEFISCKRIIADGLPVNMEALEDASSTPDQFAQPV